jgi:cystine transport system substrate-binding protein
VHKRRRVRWLVVPLLAAVSLIGLGGGAAQAAEGDPVVRVGTEGTYPPFTYVDPRSQELTGYDIEVIKAVAKRPVGS